MTNETNQHLFGVCASEMGKAHQISELFEGLRRDLEPARKNLSLSEAAVMEVVFRVVSQEIGVSVPRLRTIWYVSQKGAVGGSMS